MPQWTDEQWEAITARNESLLVSAAAGSGKTAVLVERVCHYLVELGGDIDQLLVVTFTEAAAAEMRQRIAAALRARLAQEPTSRHLLRQLALLEQAHISTIHAFCLRMLRRFFYRVDLDPAFRVMDDAEDRLLKLEVLEHTLEAHYSAEQPGAAFYELVDRYSDRSGGMLQELVLRLHDFAQSQVFPAVWLQNCKEAFAVGPEATLEELRWYGVVREQARAELENAQAALEAALSLTAHPNGPDHYTKPVQSDLALVSDLERQVRTGTWDGMVEACQKMVFAAARGRAKNDVDQELLEQVKALRDEAKRLLRGLAETLYTRSASQMLGDLRSLQRPMETLIGLVDEFSRHYVQAKQSRGLVNFSDLERLALRLLLAPESTAEQLTPSATALELQEQFTEVLCDEYQDINPVQNALLGLVAGEHGTAADVTPRLFVVGDVKQSIYRFRLAEPRIFLERAQMATEGSACRRVDLAANFRCRRSIVDGVNRFFSAFMSEAVGDVRYDARAALVHRANYPAQPTREDPPIEVFLLEGDPRLVEEARHTQLVTDGAERGSSESRTDDSGEEGEETVDLTSLEREAVLIARRITELMEEPCLVWDKKEQVYRPLRYRDIAILLRATQVKASYFIDTFRREGVPLYAETGAGYFRAPEVETFMALLAIIDNPRQDIPLAGVLRSPLGQFTAAELADIRLAASEGDFYTAVVGRAESEDALGQRLTVFLTRLDEWRTRARRGALSQLLWGIYSETGYYDYVGGMPGGGQRQANLRALYDRARQFDQFARQGLLRFLQFIGDLRSAGEDLGTAPALGENEDVVRLMSIHRSKGLEFPVVFVAGLGTAFNQRDLVGSLIYDRELGLGPQLVDPARYTRAHTLASLGVRESIRRASLSEEMRILYVALTRARERLFLVATVRGLTTSCERWQQTAETIRATGTMPTFRVVTARRFSDWMGPVLAAMELIPADVEARRPVAAEVPGWRLQLFSAAAVAGELNVGAWENAERILAEEDALAPEIRAQLTAQLAWRYPWGAATQFAAKTTVTELKRLEMREADPEHPGVSPFRQPVFRRPAFLQVRRGLAAAEVGSATHLLLQHVPLTEPITLSTVDACLAKLVAEEMLGKEAAAAVDKESIVRFAASPLGKRLRGALVWRELPFCLALPVAEAGGLGAAGQVPCGEADTDDAVLMQGIIDCMFRDRAGRWVLIDFKTDRLWMRPEAIPTAVRQRYARQLQWYARAAETILHVEVEECYIYLLAHDLAVSVEYVSVPESVSE
jgi:ATP-dependent helicase/nuclease subunit A